MSIIMTGGVTGIWKSRVQYEQEKMQREKRVQQFNLDAEKIRADRAVEFERVFGSTRSSGAAAAAQRPSKRPRPAEEEVESQLDAARRVLNIMFDILRRFAGAEASFEHEYAALKKEIEDLQKELEKQKQEKSSEFELNKETLKELNNQLRVQGLMLELKKKSVESSRASSMVKRARSMPGGQEGGECEEEEPYPYPMNPTPSPFLALCYQGEGGGYRDGAARRVLVLEPWDERRRRAGQDRVAAAGVEGRKLGEAVSSHIGPLAEQEGRQWQTRFEHHQRLIELERLRAGDVPGTPNACVTTPPVTPPRRRGK